MPHTKNKMLQTPNQMSKTIIEFALYLQRFLLIFNILSIVLLWLVYLKWSSKDEEEMNE